MIGKTIKSTAFTKHGKYKTFLKEAMNRESYRLRFNALLLNDDFLNYCRLFCEAQISGDWHVLIDEDFRAHKKRPEIDSILSAVNGNAWSKLSEWLKRITPNEINMLIYGNLYLPLWNLESMTENLFNHSYTHFVEAFRRYHLWRKFDKEPIYIMDNGEVAPSGRLVVSINQQLSQEEIRTLFSRLLTNIKTKKTRNSIAIKRDPLSGYFETISKGRGAEPAVICRYLDVAKIKKDHSRYTWMRCAKKKYPTCQSLSRDAGKGNNIAYWIVRGRFPDTSKRPS